MSIKNNYKSKFLEAYLSTNRNFFVKSVFLMCFFSGFFSKSFAQQPTTLTIHSESYYRELEKYTLIKDSLPFYFFEYCLGGQLRNETEPTHEQMIARQNVIPMPVLISGNENYKAFLLWRSSILYARVKRSNLSTAEEKIAYEKSLDPNNISIALNPQEEIAIKNVLKGISPDQTKQATENTEKEKENKKESSSNNKNSTKTTQTKDANVAVEEVFDPIPLAIKAKMTEMGEEKGWEWLYNQQIIAGNVLYCHPQTLIPKSIAIEKKEDLLYYSKVLAFWKKAYSKLLAENKFPEYTEIKNKNLNREYPEFTKTYLLSNENLNYFFKLYTKELEKAPPIEIKPDTIKPIVTD